MAQNLKINITAQDRTKQAFKGIRGGLASLKNAVFSLRGAFVGLGAGLVIKSFVDTGKSVEEIKSALERDNFMTADVAQSFGLIDEVVEKRS